MESTVYCNPILGWPITTSTMCSWSYWSPWHSVRGNCTEHHCRRQAPSGAISWAAQQLQTLPISLHLFQTAPFSVSLPLLWGKVLISYHHLYFSLIVHAIFSFSYHSLTLLSLQEWFLNTGDLPVSSQIHTSCTLCLIPIVQVMEIKLLSMGKSPY